MFPAICQANIQPHAHSFILVPPCSQLFSFLASKAPDEFSFKQHCSEPRVKMGEDDDDKWKGLKQATSIATYYCKSTGLRIIQ
jgi:hypothetical protein